MSQQPTDPRCRRNLCSYLSLFVLLGLILRIVGIILVPFAIRESGLYEMDFFRALYDAIATTKTFEYAWAFGSLTLGVYLLMDVLLWGTPALILFMIGRTIENNRCPPQQS